MAKSAEKEGVGVAFRERSILAVHIAKAGIPVPTSPGYPTKDQARRLYQCCTHGQ